MLGGQLEFALDFLKHVALGMTYRAFCRSRFAFVDVTANLANELLHDKILHFFVFPDRNCIVFEFIQRMLPPAYSRGTDRRS